MIAMRRKTDINQREDKEMFGLIAGAAIVVGALTGAFHQGQTNPDASSFFRSNSHIVHDGSTID
ncbi:hypothetical protein [Bradyrhizobium japonicum]|uniref:hypothetical protein n=1 Tax=Bradyrhizobium japonicum TaxID=375 RepID=UPI0012FD34A2|nr:hypothetical protein [Bradyrhizobium japonicum]